MLLKNDFLHSLALGIIFFLIARYGPLGGIVYNMTSGSIALQLLLFVLLPLPLLLAVCSFSFWTALVAFLPAVALFIWCPPENLFIINVITVLPTFLVLVLRQIKRFNIADHLPCLLIYYIISILILVDLHFVMQSSSLADVLLDQIHSVIIQLQTLKEVYPTLGKELFVDYIVLLIPAALASFFFTIFILHYILATMIVPKSKDNNKLRLKNLLPNYYIYLFVIFCLLTLLLHNILGKTHWHMLYIMYSICTILFIAFVIPGLALVSYLVSYNKLFIIIFILATIFTNGYLFVALCILGFLTEANFLKIKSKIIMKGR